MPMTHSFITLQKVFPNYSQNSAPTYDRFPIILATPKIHLQHQHLYLQSDDKTGTIVEIYLGITITANLSWHEHIEKLIGKINQRFGLLRSVKSFLSLDARQIFYSSTILPLFDFADVIWGDKNNSELMNSLQTLENKAAKLILDLPPLSSATEALATLHWSTLSSRIYKQRCIFIYKCTNGLIDFDFNLTTAESIPTAQDRVTTSISRKSTRTGVNINQPTSLRKTLTTWSFPSESLIL
jgi:hypothetical protein